IGGGLEGAGDMNAIAGANGDSGRNIITEATEPVGPQEVAIRVQLADEEIVAAGANQWKIGRARVEVARALECTGRQHVAATVHGNPIGRIRARAAELFYPDNIAGSVQLENESVGGAGACEVRAKVELGYAREIAGNVDAARVGTNCLSLIVV